MMVNVSSGSLHNPHNTKLPKFFSRGRRLAARGFAQGLIARLRKVRQESKQPMQQRDPGLKVNLDRRPNAIPTLLGERRGE